jgi:hypothetical protein
MPSDQHGDRSTAGTASRGAPPVVDPVSPELVLVAPPEEARRAREQLPRSPAAEWDRLRSIGPARPALQRPSAPPPRRPTRRRWWVSRTVLVGVLLLLVVSAVVVGLAGSRDTNDRKNPRLTLGPVRDEGSTPTATTPTTTAAKQPTKTTPRPTPAASRPKAHAPARPLSQKEQPRKPLRKPAKKPRHSRSRSPARPVVTGFVPTRTWSWGPQSRARRYVFSLQRNGKRVIAALTAKPRYVLPKRFRFARGRYRWRVVALTTKRGARHKLVVDSKFRLSTAGAAAANG